MPCLRYVTIAAMLLPPPYRLFIFAVSYFAIFDTFTISDVRRLLIPRDFRRRFDYYIFHCFFAFFI